jgi:DNA-binding IclR family transcriptional regulator
VAYRQQVIRVSDEGLVMNSSSLTHGSAKISVPLSQSPRLLYAASSSWQTHTHTSLDPSIGKPMGEGARKLFLKERLGK